MIRQIDISISRTFNQLTVRIEILSSLLKAITHTSGGWVYLLYLVAIPLLFPIYGLDIAKLGVIGFAFQVPAYLLSENLIKRERPYLKHDIQAVIRPPDKYSFPSGHSASAVLTTLIVSSELPELFPYLLVWMICIFVSRVSLGIHYVSDIVFGAFLGLVSYQMSHIILSYFL